MRKSMESVAKHVLSIRGHPQERENDYLMGRSKSTGKSISKCWKCGKFGHYKRD
jgi:hypothetical protein